MATRAALRRSHPPAAVQSMAYRIAQYEAERRISELGGVMLRMRATQEDATTIAMFTNTVPAIVLLPITLGLFGAPDWADIPLFFGLGILGYAVWFLMTLAYARAPAQRLAPLEYTALLWSGLFGSIFFAEYPGWQTWLGAAIIIVACLIVAVEGKFATRKATGLPASDIPE